MQMVRLRWGHLVCTRLCVSEYEIMTVQTDGGAQDLGVFAIVGYDDPTVQRSVLGENERKGLYVSAASANTFSLR